MARSVQCSAILQPADVGRRCRVMKEWIKVVQSDAKGCKGVQIGAKGYKVVESGVKQAKGVQSGKIWCTMVQRSLWLRQQTTGRK